MKTAKLVLTVLSLCFATHIEAATNYWVNPSEGLWHEPSNWQDGILPTNLDDARISNGGTALINSSHNVTNHVVTLGDTNGLRYGLLKMSGGKLNTVSDLRVGGNNLSTAAESGGSFEISGGEVRIQANLNLGMGPTAHGYLQMSGGSISVDSTGAIMAVGNRGTGAVYQTSGTIFLRAANGLVQLGRNVAAGTGSGHYTLGGGSLIATRLQLGNANGIVGSTNIFELSGTGKVVANILSIGNNNAQNSFNFTGGTLNLLTNSTILTNSGGILSPAKPNFASLSDTNVQTLAIDPIGTLVFTGTNSYVQESSGTLLIDIREGQNDFLDIGAAATNYATATIAGTIQVTLMDDYCPPLGSTFDIVAADAIAFTATVVGNRGSQFSSAVTTGTDGREVLRLTLTTQPTTSPRLTGFQVLGNGSFQFGFTNAPGRTFSVLSATNVADPANWALLGNATETSTGQYQFSHPNATASGVRFYRVNAP